MPTPAERQFARQVAAIDAQWTQNRRAAYKRVLELIEDHTNEVLAAIGRGPKGDWQAHHLNQVKAGLEAAKLRLKNRLIDEWASNSSATIQLALTGVDNPLSGLGIPITLPFSISEREAFLVSEYMPSLITGLTDEQMAVVTRALQSAVLGTETGPQIAAAVRKAVGGRIRAAVVMRTEMNRLHNLTRTRRIDELSENHPGLGKKWKHRPSKSPRPSHVALHDKVIYPAKGEKFTLAGRYKVDGPHDPSLPAEHSINCHCTVIAHYDEAQDQPDREDVAGVLGHGIPVRR